MADVRQLAREPVETIFEGAPIKRIRTADYWKTVRGSRKPVVVVFTQTRTRARAISQTLARYLALEFGKDIMFYGYPVTEGSDSRAKRAHARPAALWGQADSCHALLRQ
jgi:hypothetical protein